MPSKLRRLKKEAKEAAIFREHDMTRFVSTNHGQEYIATCKRCRRCVIVMENPPVNGIEIHGGAVAVNCSSIPKKMETIKEGIFIKEYLVKQNAIALKTIADILTGDAIEIIKTKEIDELCKESLKGVINILQEIVATNGDMSKEKQEEFGNYFMDLGKRMEEKEKQKRLQ